MHSFSSKAPAVPAVVANALRAAVFVAALASLISAEAPLQPTSFTFDKIRYSFYPGELARSWTQAQAFCGSLGKDLAIFRTRAQIMNVSEYLSEDGGVWTGYETGDGTWAPANDKDYVWKKSFGLPIGSSRAPKEGLCGLLSIANGTGIRPADCDQKKAALCSVSNPDVVEIESLRDSNLNADNELSTGEPAVLSDDGSNDNASKSSKVSVSSSSSGGSKRSKSSSGSKRHKASSGSPKKAKSSSGSKHHKVSSGSPKKAKSSSGSKKKSNSSSMSSSGSKRKSSSSGSATPKSTSSPSDASKSGTAKSSSSPSDASNQESSSSAESEAAEEPESSNLGSNDPSESTPTDEETSANPSDPVEIRSEGFRYTFFPGKVTFGGYMEFSRFCEDHGLQPAVFKSRQQMEDVAKHITTTRQAWTGYSTDSLGTMHSVDETAAPWQEDFEVQGMPATQPLMCGSLSTAATKVGVVMNSCASAHSPLCSAKSFTKASKSKSKK